MQLVVEESLKKILYIVSTLSKSGPTNQLYNIISNLDLNKFKPYLLTLSPEPEKEFSKLNDFVSIGVKVDSLGLSRIEGMLVGKRVVNRFIETLRPDLIHTQGVRADSIMASLGVKQPWVMTARNFPLDDYPSKFGRLKGSLMAHKHLAAIKRCKYLVCCSKTILAKLRKWNDKGTVIQNGVKLPKVAGKKPLLDKELVKPIFISVGGLIPRKNMDSLIRSFNKADKEKRGTLLILGDGPDREKLQKLCLENTYLIGNVNNVVDYLDIADYFISTSLSEGLPNTVLEALSIGLPAILSDIDSHNELASEFPHACHIASLNSERNAFREAIENAEGIFDGFSSKDCIATLDAKFSASVMSSRYQQLYNDLMEAE